MRAAPSCAPHLAQRTAHARQLQVDDLLPDLRDHVTGVTHDDVTYVRFASGRIQTFRPWERMQVVRDGRRAARAWVLAMLATSEFPKAMAQALPWFLAGRSGAARRLGTGDEDIPWNLRTRGVARAVASEHLEVRAGERLDQALRSFQRRSAKWLSSARGVSDQSPRI